MVVAIALVIAVSRAARVVAGALVAPEVLVARARAQAAVAVPLAWVVLGEVAVAAVALVAAGAAVAEAVAAVAEAGGDNNHEKNSQHTSFFN